MAERIIDLQTADTIGSNDYFAIDNAISGTRKILGSSIGAGSAASFALKSEGYAIGTQDGEPVQSDSPYYQNNAEYYAGEAADSAAEIEDMTVEASTLSEGASATVTKTLQDGHYNLAFGIPKGDTGAKGDTGESVASITVYYLATSASSGVTPSTQGWTTTVQTITSTNKYLWCYVVVTGDESTTISTTNPVIIGTYGDKGDTGITPDMQIGTVATLPEGSSATASITGTTDEPLLNLGIPVGDTGVGISSIAKTGTSGLVDTYTITFTDSTTTTFTVTNGQNGAGSGTVTDITAGAGLDGGTITSSGTIKAKMVTDTSGAQASGTPTSVVGKQYPVVPDSNGNLSVNVAWTDLADDYSTSTTYNVDDYCIYNGVLYICTATTTGAWDSTKWTATDVGAELTDIRDDMNNIDMSSKANLTLLADTYNPSTSYVAGEYCTYNEILYQCTGATTGAWDSTKWTATDVGSNLEQLDTDISGKQDTLVSGTNIKTVNSTSILGSGNIAVQEALVSGTNIKTVNSTSLLGSGNIDVQEKLTSGTNIKTINSTSLLGSGNISVQEALVSGTNIKTVNGSSILGSGNLELAGASQAVVSLTVAGWSNNAQTVSVTGLGANDAVVVSPTPSSIDDYSAFGIYCTALAAGSLTFTCVYTPENAISVNVLIVKTS